MTLLLLFLAAVVGGALNAVAGGGSFFTFPALVFTGMPLLEANATSTVALWPGSISSTIAYRREMARLAIPRTQLAVLIVISALGGVVGAWLLLVVSADTLDFLIPYLLLGATLLFLFKKQVTALTSPSLAIGQTGAVMTRNSLASRWSWLVLFIISIYGGFFGGGIGILMLATLSALGFQNLHQMNALKSLLVSFINGVAVVTFVVAGKVVWLEAGVMIVGAIAGGYLGAHYGSKLPQSILRVLVIGVGLALTLYFWLT